MPPLLFVIPPNLQDRRVDQALAELCGLSRRQVKREIDQGRVWRNGKVLRVHSRLMRFGDVLELLELDHASIVEPVPPQGVEVLYEDPWLAAVNKPAGILSQPSADRKEIAMDQQYLWYLAYRERQRPHLHLMHRLDRATSGVLLFSRKKEIQSPLAKLWRQGEVYREYRAWVKGEILDESFLVEDRIGRDRSHAWKFCVDPRGKSAKTAVFVLDRQPGATLVKCVLHSGRTHQVRVHLESAGYPVFGDFLYGGPAHSRLLLHACRLEFNHPMGGEKLAIQSPIPFDPPRLETQRSPTVLDNS